MIYLCALLAFLCSTASNWLCTKYIAAVSAHNRWTAANWTFLQYLCGLVTMYMVVEKNCWAMAATVLGGWVGTFISIRPKP
jgi:hypothetical protein